MKLTRRKSAILAVLLGGAAILIAVVTILLLRSNDYSVSVDDDASWADFSPPSDFPDDFAIEYSAGPCHMEWGETRITRISPTERAAGNAAFELLMESQRTVWDDEAGRYVDRVTLIRRADVSREDCLRLYRAVVSNGFFRLKREYRNTRIIDGGWEKLAARVCGKKKSVYLGNTSLRRFDRIVAVLEQIATEK